MFNLFGKKDDNQPSGSAAPSLKEGKSLFTGYAVEAPPIDFGFGNAPQPQAPQDEMLEDIVEQQSDNVVPPDAPATMPESEPLEAYDIEDVEEELHPSDADLGIMDDEDDDIIDESQLDDLILEGKDASGFEPHNEEPPLAGTTLPDDDTLEVFDIDLPEALSSADVEDEPVVEEFAIEEPALEALDDVKEVSVDVAGTVETELTDDDEFSDLAFDDITPQDMSAVMDDFTKGTETSLELEDNELPVSGENIDIELPLDTEVKPPVDSVSEEDPFAIDDAPSQLLDEVAAEAEPECSEDSDDVWQIPSEENRLNEDELAAFDLPVIDSVTDEAPSSESPTEENEFDLSGFSDKTVEDASSDPFAMEQLDTPVDEAPVTTALDFSVEDSDAETIETPDDIVLTESIEESAEPDDIDPITLELDETAEDDVLVLDVSDELPGDASTANNAEGAEEQQDIELFDDEPLSIPELEIETNSDDFEEDLLVDFSDIEDFDSVEGDELTGVVEVTESELSVNEPERLYPDETDPVDFEKQADDLALDITDLSDSPQVPPASGHDQLEEKLVEPLLQAVDDYNDSLSQMLGSPSVPAPEFASDIFPMPRDDSQNEGMTTIHESEHPASFPASELTGDEEESFDVLRSLDLQENARLFLVKMDDLYALMAEFLPMYAPESSVEVIKVFTDGSVTDYEVAPFHAYVDDNHPSGHQQFQVQLGHWTGNLVLSSEGMMLTSELIDEDY